MKFSWYSYTSTLKLHGVSGDEPEEDDVPAADEDAHGDQEQSGAEPGDQVDEQLHDEEGAADPRPEAKCYVRRSLKGLCRRN